MFYDGLAKKTTKYYFDFSGKAISSQREDLDVGCGYDSYDRLVLSTYALKHNKLSTPLINTTKYNYGTTTATKNIINNVMLNDVTQVSYGFDSLLRKNKTVLNAAGNYKVLYSYKNGVEKNTTTNQLSAINYGSGTNALAMSYEYDANGNISKVFEIR